MTRFEERPSFYVIVNHYNNYQWAVHNVAFMGTGENIEGMWSQVPSRHGRYGNAANVSRYSTRLVNFLIAHDINFSVVDDSY